jgi:predicted unusual protein kinase regulating ubiquinone biosynthesis (AarF/ABC1/UbiB family)
VIADGLAELTQQVGDSQWVKDMPGLELAACGLARQLAPRRQAITRRAEQLAAPGVGSLPRTVHHAAALQAAQLRAAIGWLPGPTHRARPASTDGADAVKDTVADILRDHLSLLGAPGAEVARIMTGSGSLAPARVTDRLRMSPIPWEPMGVDTVERVADRALPGLVRSVSPEVLGATPVLQTHRCRLADGSAALLRVRRPSARRALLSDARFTGTLAWAASQLVPGLRDAHPQGFVELTVRQLLDSLDLRNHALNAIELGLAVEALAIQGVSVARPVPGGVAAAAALFEPVDGEPATSGPAPGDPSAVGTALASVLVLAAIGRGVFLADPDPQFHLRGDGDTTTFVGCPVLGRLTPILRTSGYDFLSAVLSGDHSGQVAAMRAAGAVPDATDVDELIADLAASGGLDPMALLGTDGPAALLGGLREAVTVLLRHRLRPPLEVVLLMRGLFALQEVLPVTAPGATLTGSLLPLLPRLPELAHGS